MAGLTHELLDAVPTIDRMLTGMLRKLDLPAPVLAAAARPSAIC